MKTFIWLLTILSMDYFTSRYKSINHATQAMTMASRYFIKQNNITCNTIVRTPEARDGKLCGAKCNRDATKVCSGYAKTGNNCDMCFFCPTSTNPSTITTADLMYASTYPDFLSDLTKGKQFTPYSSITPKKKYPSQADKLYIIASTM